MAEQTENAGEKGEGEGKKNASPKAPLNTTNLLLMVVLAILVLLIIAGGIGAVLILRSTSAPATAQATTDASAAGKDKEKPQDKKPPAKEAKKDDKPKSPAIYVTLEPPFVVNFKAGKPAKFLQINMEVMTRDQGAAQVLKDNNPLLRNDLLALIGNEDYESVATAEGREALRARALEATRGVVKKEGGKPQEIEAVYFTSFVMQ